MPIAAALRQHSAVCVCCASAGERSKGSKRVLQKNALPRRVHIIVVVLAPNQRVHMPSARLSLGICLRMATIVINAMSTPSRRRALNLAGGCNFICRQACRHI